MDSPRMKEAMDDISRCRSSTLCLQCDMSRNPLCPAYSAENLLPTLLHMSTRAVPAQLKTTLLSLDAVIGTSPCLDRLQLSTLAGSLATNHSVVPS